MTRDIITAERAHRAYRRAGALWEAFKNEICLLLEETGDRTMEQVFEVLDDCTHWKLTIKDVQFAVKELVSEGQLKQVRDEVYGVPNRCLHEVA